MGNTKVTYVVQKEFGTMFAINNNRKWEVLLQCHTMTSPSEKLSSSVIESASENGNQNSSSSDNETLPDSPIKGKRKQRCIQHLCAEEHSEDEPPESYETKLDTVETGRNNEADDTEKNSEIAEEKQIFSLRLTLK